MSGLAAVPESSEAESGDGLEDELDGPQVSFEGIVIDKHRLGLQSAANLPARRRMALDEHTSGRFWGTVREIRHERNRDGVVVRKHLIEVTEVVLDG